MTTVIETKNLVRIFGKDETKVTALDHVNVTIEKGEFTAIIGLPLLFFLLPRIAINMASAKPLAPS